MSAGGYIYEKETAVYDSSIFTTRRMWGLHVFRKQIYAFLKAATRSATVNGDAESYWDFDTRYNSGAFKLDNDETNDGVAQIHTDAEWQLVSKKMADDELAANAISPIFSYTSDASAPAFGCFFVGAGGEHLFFANAINCKPGTGSSNEMGWYASNNTDTHGSNSVLDYSRNNTYYKVPGGFTVMFSPDSDFSGNNPSTAGFRPTSCTSPVSMMSTFYGSVTGGSHCILGTTLASVPYSLGFLVKRDQMAFMLSSDTIGLNKFKFILFGNILDNLSNEGDTSKQAVIVITDRESETQTTSISNDKAYLINMLYSNKCSATLFAECANANGDCAMGSFGMGSNLFTLNPASGSTGSASLSDIPYSAMQIFLTEKDPRSGVVNYMIKDGNGAKGIVNTDLLRLIPIQKVYAGLTCDGGNFFMPVAYPGPSGYDQQPNLSFAIGWDPSNEL